VNNSTHSADVDGAVEHLPAAAAEAADPAGGGSERERDQQHEGGETHGDIAALLNIFPHASQIERLVRPDVGEEVQTNIEESEQAQHATKANQVREIEKFSKRCNRKCEDEKAERPIAGSMLHKFNGIRAETGMKRAPDKRCEGHQANEEEGGFGPLAGEERAHSEFPP